MGVKAYNPEDPDSFEVSIYGYGYETLPDNGIRAGDVPEPASLLLLGVGSLAYFGRKRLSL